MCIFTSGFCQVCSVWRFYNKKAQSIAAVQKVAERTSSEGEANLSYEINHGLAVQTNLIFGITQMAIIFTVLSILNLCRRGN
jgi:hypothetical protein